MGYNGKTIGIYSPVIKHGNWRDSNLGYFDGDLSIVVFYSFDKFVNIDMSIRVSPSLHWSACRSVYLLLYYNWCTYVYVSVSVYVYVYVKVYVCEYVYVYVYVWLYAYVSIDVEYKYISGIIGVEAGYSSVGDISVDASIEW